ncbi:MAG: Flp pilus assembly complex ATPase component TadA [Coriobacteriales bacterium]|nr:Flp pilus assembly complex ATPase component TadA [Coriobacteriales bacterium]
MAGMTTISGRALDGLVAAGLITEADAQAAVESAHARAVPLGRELTSRALVTTAQVARVLEDDLGVPRVDLTSYAPDRDALAAVPGATARSSRVLPLFEIEGMLTVAIGDPMDVFALDELGAALGCEVEAVLADGESVMAAIEQHYPPRYVESDSEEEAEPVVEVASEPLAEIEELETAESLDSALSAADFFEVLGVHAEAPAVAIGPVAGFAEDAAHAEASAEAEASEEPAAESLEEPTAEEAPEPLSLEAAFEQVVAEPSELPEPADRPIDLDVLAVADDRRVAALVSEILELAVARSASRVHVLPYKSDFFVVFRVKGRLEKIASAPLSLQPALVDAFKSFGKLGSVPSSLPALGRVRAEIGGRQLVLTVSAVPTVSGQRLVVSLGVDRAPRSLEELGMSDAEVRAMQAMVERGRGILLVAAPVAGGRSSTYYALLAHAAAVGKTVYSVERAIEHEIPAVAQILVNPGSAVEASAYLAAGLRQDTDVIAIDSMQSVEEVHLAIEAAGIGKLVIATFAGADVAAAVRRMLDLGAEPVSLASALTLGVGQRVVRTSCPACLAPEPGDLVKRVPGVERDLIPQAGAGCDACGDGFAGTTGIFEVLPFTDSVRASIAADDSLDEIEAAARAAGLRPMSASGLTRVREGVVSLGELDRVLRLSERR